MHIEIVYESIFVNRMIFDQKNKIFLNIYVKVGKTVYFPFCNEVKLALFRCERWKANAATKLFQ